MTHTHTHTHTHAGGVDADMGDGQSTNKSNRSQAGRPHGTRKECHPLGQLKQRLLYCQPEEKQCCAQNFFRLPPVNVDVKHLVYV